VIETLDGAQRAHLLAEVAGAVAWSSDTGTTMRRVAELIVPRLADWCLVDVREGETAYQRLTIVHTDPQRQARVSPLLGAWTLDEGRRGVLDVIRTGERQVVADGATPAALLPRADAACERLIDELGLAGYVSVPLCAHARTLGALTLVAAGPRPRFDDGAVTLAETVGRVTALAIPSVRLDVVAPPPGRRQDDLLTALSHQLRTPLTAILAWLRLARHGGNRAELARALDIIERNGRALGRLVDELLDTVGVLTGGASITRRPLDLVEIVERATASLADAARTKGVGVDAELDASAAAYVGDASRLEQVAAVLVANAVRFTPPGGRVTVRLDGDSAHSRLRVTDSGPGIPPAHLPYVFGLFRRGASEPGGEGLGLELAMARGLVELHGGRVEAASEGPGRGATFTVILPRAPILPPPSV
jgi:signal transduction histidine kinase